MKFQRTRTDLKYRKNLVGKQQEHFWIIFDCATGKNLGSLPLQRTRIEISWFKITRTDFRQPKIVGKQKTWLSALKKN